MEKDNTIIREREKLEELNVALSAIDKEGKFFKESQGLISRYINEYIDELNGDSSDQYSDLEEEKQTHSRR